MIILADMSKEEAVVLRNYAAHVVRSKDGWEKPLNFEQWCAYKVINPAPLIAWYEKHKAKKH